MQKGSNKQTRRLSKALCSTALYSAAWGGVVGMILLLVATTVPAQASGTVTPLSVVWGGGNSTNTTNNGLPASSSTTASTAAVSKLAADLKDHVRQDGTLTVIVQHRKMPSNAHLADLQSRGAVIKNKFHCIPAVTMRVPVGMLAELQKDANVKYVSPDRPLTMKTNPTTEDYVPAIEADVAASQYGLTGAGIGVAVIDSGISPNVDLDDANGNNRIVYNQSFVAGDTTTADAYGHGTHVTGLIAGTGASSGTANGYPATYAGVAPAVTLINLRVLDQNGSGTDSQVIAAIDQAIALESTYNIRVINMSLGRPVFESYTLDPVDQAVEAAWKAGIVVVCAAGNNGRYAPTNGFATIDVPGNDPAVITVGATRTNGTATVADDTIASYSSKGPTAVDYIVKPDLVAPGNQLPSLRVPGSTLDTTYPQFEITSTNGTSNYFVLSGTSMATPLVSGSVAQLLQQNPSLTPDQVKARLMKSAWKGFGQFTTSYDHLGNAYNNEYDLFTYGAGNLNLDAALGNTDLASGLALSQTATPTAGNVVTVANTAVDSLFSGYSVVWGATSVVWGNSVVWGSGVLSADSVVWGATSVVWGATSDTADSVVWGATSSAASDTSALSDSGGGDD